MEISFGRSYQYDVWPQVPALVRSLQTGRELAFMATVDTGAQRTIFDHLVARFLNLDLTRAEPGRVLGLGGSTDTGWLSPVEITVLDDPQLTVRLDAGFVPNLSEEFANLLGMDYFLGVNLAVIHANRTLYFGPA